jgi:hypothetical protein
MKVATNVSAEGPGKRRLARVKRKQQSTTSVNRADYYKYEFRNKKEGEDGLSYESEKKLYDAGRKSYQADKDRGVPDYGPADERRLQRMSDRMDRQAERKAKMK